MTQFPYTDETGRRIRPKPLVFRIQWLDDERRVIGGDTIRRVDLSAATVAACNMLKAGKGGAKWANGFVVAVLGPDTSTTSTTSTTNTNTTEETN